jgi:hypothetical protein
MRAPSYEAGKNGGRFHRVGVAFLAIAGVLVGLHLAGEVAPFVHADGGGDSIRKHGLYQFLDAVEAFYFNELGELRSANCVVHLLLLATDARGFGRQMTRGRSEWNCSRHVGG